ncbi:MAG: hypothetical protein ACLFU8_04125 [Anaerolineales bacterium]
MEPYRDATSSEELFPRIVAELESSPSPLKKVYERLWALHLPRLASWAISVQGQQEFSWQMELLPQINPLPQQILAMRLITA